MVKKIKYVAEPVKRRIPQYYDCLLLLQESGVKKVSSERIAQLLDFTASQVRQDLSKFGEFGQQGYGYDVDHLTEQIKTILGLNNPINIIVLGGGKIGQAIVNYNAFLHNDIKFNAIFDIDMSKQKQLVNIPFYHIDSLEDYLSKNEVDIAVLTTPREVAQELCDRLIDGNVKALWNFTRQNLKVSRDIIVENINIFDSLSLLTYKITNPE